MNNKEFIDNLDNIFLLAATESISLIEAAEQIKNLVKENIDFSNTNEIAQVDRLTNYVKIEIFPECKDHFEMGLGKRPKSLRLNEVQKIHVYCRCLLRTIGIYGKNDPIRYIAKKIMDEIPINWPLPTSPFDDNDPYIKI